MSVDDDDDDGEGYEQRTDLEGRSSGHNISAPITPHNYPLTITPSLNVLSVHSSSFTTWPPFSRLRCWVDVNEDVWWRRVKGELANPRLPVRMVIEPTCACVCVIVMCVRGSTLLSRRAWTLITWLHWCLKLCRSTRASSSAQQRRTVRMLHSSSPDLCRRELVLAACNSFQRFWFPCPKYCSKYVVSRLFCLRSLKVRWKKQDERLIQSLLTVYTSV